MNQKLKILLAVVSIFCCSIFFHYPRFSAVIHSFSQQQVAQTRIKLLPTIQALWNSTDLLCQFDCIRFQKIATQRPEEMSTESAAFFPLWTSMIRWGHQLFPTLKTEHVSILLSNLFSVVGVAFLMMLGTLIWKKQPTCLAGWSYPGFLLGLASAIYPHSLIFSFGYSEPLFLTLYALALCFCIRERWNLAALSIGLMGICRNQGVWVAGLFTALIAWDHWKNGFYTDLKKRKSRIAQDFILFGLAFTPFLLYLAWQYFYFGSPFMFLKAQAAWDRKFDLVVGLEANLPNGSFDKNMVFLQVIGAILLFRKRGFFWKFLGLNTFFMAELPPYFGGFFSYPRFTSVNIGLLVIAVEYSRKYGWLAIALVIGSVMGLGNVAYDYFHGQTYYCP